MIFIFDIINQILLNKIHEKEHHIKCYISEDSVEIRTYHGDKCIRTFRKEDTDESTL